MKTLKNITLRQEILALLPNIKSIDKNQFDLATSFSIDITEIEPVSVSSYVYTSEEARDADFVIVTKLFTDELTPNENLPK